MKKEVWQCLPRITPNYGTPRRTPKSSAVPLSNNEMVVILRTNPSHDRQLNVTLTNLAAEHERNLRLLRIDRRMFVARQVSKHQRLRGSGPSLPPQLAQIASSQDDDIPEFSPTNDDGRRVTCSDQDSRAPAFLPRLYGSPPPPPPSPDVLTGDVRTSAVQLKKPRRPTPIVHASPFQPRLPADPEDSVAAERATSTSQGRTSTYHVATLPSLSEQGEEEDPTIIAVEHLSSARRNRARRLAVSTFMPS